MSHFLTKFFRIACINLPKKFLAERMQLKDSAKRECLSGHLLDCFAFFNKREKESNLQVSKQVNKIQKQQQKHHLN